MERLIRLYREAVFDTDRDRALGLIHEAVETGVTPEQIVFDVVIPSLEQMVRSVSEDFDTNLAQHYMTAQIAAEVTEQMVRRFQEPPRKVGLVVIGTSRGDLHTLGKRIVTGCLKSLMIDVVDLGVNVTPEHFVDEALARGAQVIAISSMMLHTARSPQGALGVRALLRERGLESRFRLVVGGAPFRFDPELYRVVGADAWAPDGLSAAQTISDMIKAVPA